MKKVNLNQKNLRQRSQKNKNSRVFAINKKEGETPLDAVSLFRQMSPVHKESKITYAGRLDPMAEGLLVLLVDDEVHRKEDYLKLPKEYEFEVLFGFATDTYDVLGKVTNKHPKLLDKKFLRSKIKKTLKSFRGKITQTYPPYSSKTVDGKPLFAYAREGVEVELPENKVHIRRIELLGMQRKSAREILREVKERIAKVQGDFRQEEILDIWHGHLKDIKRDKFLVGKFVVRCTSGTYVRSIAHELGKNLETGALAYRIKRTKVGPYTLGE